MKRSSVSSDAVVCVLQKSEKEHEKSVKLMKSRPPTDLHGYIAHHYGHVTGIQKFDIAYNLRLALPLEISSKFRTTEELYSLFHSPEARIIRAKYEDENKAELLHDENLDFKDEMEKEARMVFGYFFDKQCERDDYVVEDSSQRATLGWCIQESFRRDRRLQRLRKVSAESPGVDMLLCIQPMEASRIMTAAPFTIPLVKDNAVLPHAGGQTLENETDEDESERWDQRGSKVRSAVLPRSFGTSVQPETTGEDPFERMLSELVIDDTYTGLMGMDRDTLVWESDADSDSGSDGEGDEAEGEEEGGEGSSGDEVVDLTRENDFATATATARNKSRAAVTKSGGAATQQRQVVDLSLDSEEDDEGHGSSSGSESDSNEDDSDDCSSDSDSGSDESDDCDDSESDGSSSSGSEDDEDNWDDEALPEESLSEAGEETRVVVLSSSDDDNAGRDSEEEEEEANVYGGSVNDVALIERLNKNDKWNFFRVYNLKRALASCHGPDHTPDLTTNWEDVAVEYNTQLGNGNGDGAPLGFVETAASLKSAYGSKAKDMQLVALEDPFFESFLVKTALQERAQTADIAPLSFVEAEKLVDDTAAYRARMEQVLKPKAPRKKIAHSPVVRVPTGVMPRAKHLPKSMCWVSLPYNSKTEDELFLRSMPYFGDEDMTGVDISDFDKIPGELESEVMGEAEEWTILHMIDKYKRSNGLIRPEVYSALHKVLGVSISEISRAYDKIFEGHYYIKNVREKGNPNYKERPWPLRRVNGDAALLPLRRYDTKAVSIEDTPFGVGLGVVNDSDYCKVAENYREFFCRRCFVYNCNNHSIAHPLPRVRVDPVPPHPCPIPGLSLPTDSLRHIGKSGHAVDWGSLSMLAIGDLSVGSAVEGIPHTQSAEVLSVIGGDSQEAGEVEFLGDHSSSDCAVFATQNSFVDDFRVAGKGSVAYQPQSFELMRRTTERKRQREQEELEAKDQDRPSHKQQRPNSVRNGHSSAGINSEDESCESEQEQEGFLGELNGLNSAVGAKKAAPAESSVSVVRRIHNSAGKVPYDMFVDRITKGRRNQTSPAAKNGNSAVAQAPPLTDVERAIITRLHEIQTVNASYPPTVSSRPPSGPCDEEVAAMLGTRSLDVVRDFLQPALGSSEVVTVDSDEDEEGAEGGARGGNNRKFKRKKAAKAKTTAIKNNFHREFTPCDHDGPCTMSVCSCLRNGTFCEKFCACSVDCKHKFQGCKCRGGCGTKACPCFAACRGCDPDLCGQCGACIHPLMLPLVEAHLLKNKSDQPVLCREVSAASAATTTVTTSTNSDEEGVDEEGNGVDFKVCTNTWILQQKRKRVMLGRSEIHGWGAFVTERVEKNEFITEYVGEVITQDEADRRGKVYDKQDCSFLFSLNEEQVVDSTRKGNKSKFLNHSVNNANCVTKIMAINGDHKIGMYARRAIEAGEELTFNYGHLFDSAPKWNSARKEKLKFMERGEN